MLRKSTFWGLIALVCAAATIEELYLKLHKHYRRRRNASALELEPKLKGKAEAASKAFLNTIDPRNLPLSDSREEGENMTLKKRVVDQGIKNWYAEKIRYSKAQNHRVLQHFTQLAWNNTTHLHCVGNASSYVVAHFLPPGSIDGQHKKDAEPKNVGRGHVPAYNSRSSADTIAPWCIPVIASAVYGSLVTGRLGVN